MVARLLDMTSDPSSMELRRSAQRGVVGLFELNPASLTLLIRNVPKKQQDDANRIIKAHMQVGVVMLLSLYSMGVLMQEGPGEDGEEGREEKPAASHKVRKERGGGKGEGRRERRGEEGKERGGGKGKGRRERRCF